MKLTLRIWRQTTASDLGSYETYLLENVSSDLSLLEALDQLNEQLISSGRRPVSFEHDCREGICGSCGFLVKAKAMDHAQPHPFASFISENFPTVLPSPWRHGKPKRFPPSKT